jgi:hypothetical protein
MQLILYYGDQITEDTVFGPLTTHTEDEKYAKTFSWKTLKK